MGYIFYCLKFFVKNCKIFRDCIIKLILIVVFLFFGDYGGGIDDDD